MLFTKLPLRLEASTAAWLAAFFGSFWFFCFVFKFPPPCRLVARKSPLEERLCRGKAVGSGRAEGH